jgi:hypothetical protein
MATGAKRARQRDDYTDRIEALFDDHGIVVWFARGRKHRSVTVTHAGRTQTFFFPLTGSDWRGPHNTVSGLRRALGLRGAP